MKYNININQHALSDSKLDLIDAAILDWLIVICNSKNKKIANRRNKGFTQVDYQFLIGDMPLLRLKSKSQLTPRIKRLEKEGYIEVKRVKHQSNYIALTEKVDKLFFQENRAVLPDVQLAVLPEESTLVLDLDSNTKSDIPDEPDFNFDEYVKKMRENTRDDIKLIGTYLFLQAKDFNIGYLTKDAIESIVKRNLRDAKEILTCEKPAINAAFQKVREDSEYGKKFEWKLSTVKKKLIR